MADRNVARTYILFVIQWLNLKRISQCGSYHISIHSQSKSIKIHKQWIIVTKCWWRHGRHLPLLCVNCNPAINFSRQPSRVVRNAYQCFNYEPIKLQLINIISFVHYNFQYFDWETHKISWKFAKNSLLRVWNLTVVIPCVDSIKAKSHRHCIGELSWWIWDSSGSPAKFRVCDVDNNSIKLLVNSLSTIISNI